MKKIALLLMLMALILVPVFLVVPARAEGSDGTLQGLPQTALLTGDSDEGCTPGGWKNHMSWWSGTPYSATTKVNTVFISVTVRFTTLGNETLLDALQGAGGPGLSGAAEILLRAGTAGVLNASHTDPVLKYPSSASEIIQKVNEQLKNGTRETMLALAVELDEWNNGKCPLDKPTAVTYSTFSARSESLVQKMWNDFWAQVRALLTF